MEIYYIISVVLFILCYYSIGQSWEKQKQIAYLLLILLILFDGLRWENGTDWKNYYDFFIDSSDDRFAIFEPGFFMLNKVVYTIWPNYTFLLLIQAILTYIVLWRFVKKYSPQPVLSVLLFFLLYVSVQGMNRQFWAILICLLSIDYLLSDKKWHFVCAVFVAFTFHTSALLFLCGLFLRRSFSMRLLLMLFLISVMLSLTSFVSKLVDVLLVVSGGDVAMRVMFYSNMDYNDIASSGLMMIVAIAKRLIWIIPILWLRNKKGLSLSPYINLFLNYYIVGLIIYLIFNGSMLQILVSRASIYFNMFEIILIPYVIVNFRRRLSLRLLYIVVYFYGILTMTKGINQYDMPGGNPFIPYKTIYMNQNVQKNVN